MKVLNAKVNWNEGWANKPTLEILADALPPTNSLIYKEKENCYFAELDGFVSFHYHSGNPIQQAGYGGRHFTLQMEDGTTKILKGPWSSRSGVMNKFFTPSIEVHCFTDIQSWKRGHTAYGVAITEELFLKAVAEFCPEVTVDKYASNDEDGATLYMRKVDNPCQICKGSGTRTRFNETTTCNHCSGTGHQKGGDNHVR